MRLQDYVNDVIVIDMVDEINMRLQTDRVYSIELSYRLDYTD